MDLLSTAFLEGFALILALSCILFGRPFGSARRERAGAVGLVQFLGMTRFLQRFAAFMCLGATGARTLVRYVTGVAVSDPARAVLAIQANVRAIRPH